MTLGVPTRPQPCRRYAARHLQRSTRSNARRPPTAVRSPRSSPSRLRQHGAVRRATVSSTACGLGRSPRRLVFDEVIAGFAGTGGARKIRHQAGSDVLERLSRTPGRRLRRPGRPDGARGAGRSGLPWGRSRNPGDDGGSWCLQGLPSLYSTCTLGGRPPPGSRMARRANVPPSQRVRIARHAVLHQAPGARLQSALRSDDATPPSSGNARARVYPPPSQFARLRRERTPRATSIPRSKRREAMKKS